MVRREAGASRGGGAFDDDHKRASELPPTPPALDVLYIHGQGVLPARQCCWCRSQERTGERRGPGADAYSATNVAAAVIIAATTIVLHWTAQLDG